MIPRFVILTHDHPFLHWDFMLEWGESLRTWRLRQQPNVSELPASKTLTIAADPLPDHRLHYLDYEGPVGDNRGEVRRWDWGEYTLLEADDDSLKVELKGQKLRCVATLRGDKARENATAAQWQFSIENE